MFDSIFKNLLCYILFKVFWFCVYLVVFGGLLTIVLKIICCWQHLLLLGDGVIFRQDHIVPSSSLRHDSQKCCNPLGADLFTFLTFSKDVVLGPQLVRLPIVYGSEL